MTAKCLHGILKIKRHKQRFSMQGERKKMAQVTLGMLNFVLLLSSAQVHAIRGKHIRQSTPNMY